MFALGFALLLRLPVQAWLGEIDLNNLVNQADLNAIAQKLGLKNTEANYSRALDLSLDDKINVVDLAIAGRSYGAPHLFHSVRQISNCVNCVSYQESCLDGLGRINILWRTLDERIFFSLIDRFGNTLVDDVLLASGVDEPISIACDQSGNAHLFWIKNSLLYQARFDAWGYPILEPQKVYDENVVGTTGTEALASAIDNEGNAFVFLNRLNLRTPLLLRIGPQGELNQCAVGSRSGTSNTTPLYHQLQLDSLDNLHLLWYEVRGDDCLYYTRYANQPSLANPSSGEHIVGYTEYDGAVTTMRKPDLKVDSEGNVYVLWKKGSTPNLPKLFLEKIDPSGQTLLDDHLLFDRWQSGGVGPATSEIALGPTNQLYLLSVTDWGKGTPRSALGSFTAQGTPISPLRWIFYGAPMGRPSLLVDHQEDVHITFHSTSTKGYPPCSERALCYLGTAFNTESYDLTRSDLGIDAAHLIFEPLISRWGGTLAITTTVYNEGWAGASASSLLITLETQAGQKIVETSHSIGALAPHAQQELNNLQLSLPTMPPEGLEEIEYLRLRFSIDPQNLLTETTKDNNVLSVPILVQKIPTKTGLFLVVEDETDTVREGTSETLTVGTASLQGGSYSKSGIKVEETVTLLAKDIPVTNELVNYTVSWQASGYSIPTPVVIGVKRNSSDPYRIDYSPSKTAVLKTNRWGSLSGNISSGGSPLAGATVRLVGEGLSNETTTDAAGNFSPSREPKLAKLIPGTYQIRVSKAGYARLIDTLVISPLGSHTYNRSMNTTTDFYLHGSVVNQYGNPVIGAAVNACGATTTTDGQGVFDLTVNASCTTLSITRSGYANLSEPLSLTAGLETIKNLTMSFDPPVTLFSIQSRVASLVVDQSTGGLLPEPPPDAKWSVNQAFKLFKDTFWPDERIISSCLSGSSGLQRTFRRSAHAIRSGFLRTTDL